MERFLSRVEMRLEISRQIQSSDMLTVKEERFDTFFFAWENSGRFFSSIRRAERDALRETPAIDRAPS